MLVKILPYHKRIISFIHLLSFHSASVMSLLDVENEDRSIGFFPNDGLGIGFIPVERSFGGGAGGAGGAM